MSAPLLNTVVLLGLLERGWVLTISGKAAHTPSRSGLAQLWTCPCSFS